MIQTSSVVLAVDANMPLTIARDGGSGSLVAALCPWISSVVQRTEPRPRGKTVTVPAANGILHGCWTGLNRGGRRVSQGTKSFRRTRERSRPSIAGGMSGSACGS